MLTAFGVLSLIWLLRGGINGPADAPAWNGPPIVRNISNGAHFSADEGLTRPSVEGEISARICHSVPVLPSPAWPCGGVGRRRAELAISGGLSESSIAVVGTLTGVWLGWHAVRSLLIGGRESCILRPSDIEARTPFQEPCHARQDPPRRRSLGPGRERR